MNKKCLQVKKLNDIDRWLYKLNIFKLRKSSSFNFLYSSMRQLKNVVLSNQVELHFRGQISYTLTSVPPKAKKFCSLSGSREIFWRNPHLGYLLIAELPRKIKTR